MSDPTPPAVSEAMREAVALCECGAEIDPNAVFEPGVCDPCSARRFNEEAAAHRNPAPPPIPVRGRFYMICCEHCDWVGSSEQCGTDAGQDDSDVYCPVCCQAMLCEEPGEADTAKHGQAVFDRIEAAEAETARLRAALDKISRETEREYLGDQEYVYGKVQPYRERPTPAAKIARAALTSQEKTDV